MRAVGVHRDVVVVTSRIWQTTATAVRAGEESMLIDSNGTFEEYQAAQLRRRIGIESVRGTPYWRLWVSRHFGL